MQRTDLHQKSQRGLPAGQAGVTVMLVLAFMGIFIFLLGTILSYTLMQGRYGRALYAREQALNIAEAGLEYYRWFLAHNPSIMIDGVGLVSPATVTVMDPEGGDIGEATVSATANTACDIVQSIDLTSVGESNASSLFTRTLSARYMRPSVAEYSNLLNASVWAGSDRNITGPYFSNGGIRMDGTNNSTVSSAVEEWTCTSSFGCSPTQTVAGVFGGGSGSVLWQYPAASFDFAGISTNFSTLQGYAQSAGVALNTTTVQVDGVQQGSSFSSVGGTDQRGFRVVFRSDGTIDVYRVTGTTAVDAYNSVVGWYDDYNVITSQSYVGRFTPPSDCALIFAQAKLWLEGVVSGKVTIIAADTGSYAPDIILNDNLTYATGDGTTGLSAIAESDVLVGLVVPDMMTVRGIFVAQNGWLGRNYYSTSYLPSQYDQYALRSLLTTIGTVVSNNRIGTKWSCGGSYCSGFNNRVDTYDRLLAFDPPPFTPAASVDYKLVLWREE